MIKVVWSQRARADLAGILEYVRRDSPRYAELVTAHILLAVDRLEQFPESGRLVPELNDPAMREVIWKSYRIVYRFVGVGEPIAIVTVFRSERQFPEPRA